MVGDNDERTVKLHRVHVALGNEFDVVQFELFSPGL